MIAAMQDRVLSATLGTAVGTRAATSSFHAGVVGG
jgi:hypothetical protein